MASIRRLNKALRNLNNTQLSSSGSGSTSRKAGQALSEVPTTPTNGLTEPATAQAASMADDLTALKPKPSRPKSPQLTRPSGSGGLNNSEMLRVGAEARRPWSQYPRDTDSPLYYGTRSIGEWKGREAELMQTINDELVTGRLLDAGGDDLEDLTWRMQAQFGSNFRDLSDNIERAAQTLRRGGAPTLESNAVRMGVPAAEADERLGRALLELSGYEQAELLNSLDPFATDLRARANGQVLNIDSQKRLNDGLNIKALFNVETPEGIQQALHQLKDEDISVMEALQRLQSGSREYSYDHPYSGQESKLFETTDRRFNPNPSDTFLNNADIMAKDGLLISDHVGTPHGRDFLYHHGPFNATLPSGGFSLLDLNALRNDLNNIPLSELQNRGGNIRGARTGGALTSQARRRGNMNEGVVLQLPMSYVQGINSNLPPITEEARRYLRG